MADTLVLKSFKSTPFWSIVEQNGLEMSSSWSLQLNILFWIKSKFEYNAPFISLMALIWYKETKFSTIKNLFLKFFFVINSRSLIRFIHWFLWFAWIHRAFCYGRKVISKYTQNWMDYDLPIESDETNRIVFNEIPSFFPHLFIFFGNSTECD